MNGYSKFSNPNKFAVYYYSLERAIVFLNEQDAVGTVKVKVVQPRTKYVIQKTPG